jgi:hypothetical protein
MLGAETRGRELAPLNRIRDHNAKYVLTLDHDAVRYDGVKQVNLVDWLLRKR